MRYYWFQIQSVGATKIFTTLLTYGMLPKILEKSCDEYVIIVIYTVFYNYSMPLKMKTDSFDLHYCLGN